MSLASMEEQGLLEPLAGTPEEVASLLETAQRHLADAQLPGMSPQSLIVHAYHVILACATAALRAQDWRVPNIEGKDKHTVDTLQFTLGIKPREVKYFQTLRQKRHEDLYEGGLVASEMEARDALEAAQELLHFAEKDLRTKS